MPFALTEEFKPDTVGAFLSVPPETYRSAPGYSNSDLSILARSPMDFRRSQEIPRRQTKALEWGELFHASVLLGKKEYHVRPETYGPENKPWHAGATECKKWLAQHEDLAVLSPREEARLNGDTNYVLCHPQARKLLEGGHSEVSLFARDENVGYLLKGRLDKFHLNEDHVLIVDLKTTLDASTRSFSKEIFARRYHVQAAMYRRLAARLTGLPVRYAFVVVEKGDFLKVNCKYLSAGAMDVGEGVLDKNIDLLRTCRLTNTWPEWADSTDNIDYIDLPDFVYENTEILTGMTEATHGT